MKNDDHQLSLFDGSDLLTRDAARLARKSDPATSHAAAQELVASGELNRQQLIVHAALERYGPCTPGELSAQSGLDYYIIARRMPEIERAGMAKRITERPCKVRGRTATEWRAQ